MLIEAVRQKLPNLNAQNHEIRASRHYPTVARNGRRAACGESPLKRKTGSDGGENVNAQTSSPEVCSF